jgi:hypothetical protein
LCAVRTNCWPHFAHPQQPKCCYGCALWHLVSEQAGRHDSRSGYTASCSSCGLQEYTTRAESVLLMPKAAMEAIVWGENLSMYARPARGHSVTGSDEVDIAWSPTMQHTFCHHKLQLWLTTYTQTLPSCRQPKTTVYQHPHQVNIRPYTGRVSFEWLYRRRRKL